MINYIPLDYYSGNKKTVYGSTSLCKKKEGSSIGFDVEKYDLSVSKIVGGKVVNDNTKKNARDKKRDAEKYRDDRKTEYKEKGLFMEKFIEMLIEEDVEGMAAFRTERDLTKVKFPKP